MPRSFRAPQGILRTLILAYAARSPVNGSDIARSISKDTDGAWNPSPGSLYYILNELKEDGQLLEMKSEGERRYICTKKGEEEMSRARAVLRDMALRYMDMLHLLAKMLKHEDSERVALAKKTMSAGAQGHERLGRPKNTAV
ncbi:MAG: PadR family transcriptional regulator [Nitrososphaerota archaeon]|nr:PadR family transcriptional regulator [Nitrososphaerota archaeon]MDG6940041.1 PadR family transcriptional regulator [Nitrososphaerota archaeon]